MLIRDTQGAYIGSTRTSRNQAWSDLLVHAGRKREGFNSSKRAIIKAGSHGNGPTGLTTDCFEPVAFQEFEHPVTLHPLPGLDRPSIKE